MVGRDRRVGGYCEGHEKDAASVDSSFTLARLERRAALASFVHFKVTTSALADCHLLPTWCSAYYWPCNGKSLVRFRIVHSTWQMTRCGAVLNSDITIYSITILHSTMNNSLIDPFILAQDYPESLTGRLSRFIICDQGFPGRLTRFRIWARNLHQVQPQRGLARFWEGSYGITSSRNLSGY